MDYLYIGDIPLNFKYGTFSNDYITLYNKPTARNETLQYYRVYTNRKGFYYTTGTQVFGQNTTTFDNIKVSDKWLHRNDVCDIFTCIFILSFFFVFLLNIVTSVFKKGGIFGGLI